MMMGITSKIRYRCLGILALSLLVSCSGDNSDLKKYIHDIKSRPATPISPIPAFAPLPKFTYPENDTRRNPFKPIEFKQAVDQFAPDQKRQKQALEAFPLDALKFVGTLKQGNELWALIKQPDGKIDRARVGDYMGMNYGRIVLIKDGKIKLEETTRESGKWAKHYTSIILNAGK